MCLPHPAHVALPHFLQPHFQHMRTGVGLGRIGSLCKSGVNSEDTAINGSNTHPRIKVFAEVTLIPG